MTGLAASGLVLGTVSVLIDLADHAALRQSPPEAGAVEVPPGSGFDAVREDREVALPGTGLGPAQPSVPRVEPPAPDDLAPLSGADTAPPGAPATGEAGALGSPPEGSEAAGGVATGAESPVLPSPQALAPSRPEGEARLSITTETAQPPAPDPGESDAGLARPEGDPPQAEAEPAQTDPAPQTTEPGTAAADSPAEAAAQDSQAAEREAASNSGPDEGAPEPESSAPRRIAPAGTLENQAEGITVNRLPRIGDDPQAEAEAEAEPKAGVEEGATDPDDPDAEPQTALERNAVPFTAPEGKPLMAIVLLDEGQGSLGLEALQAFPYPLSFAIPAGRPDAADLAERYRAAGFEVLLAADLPENATAADAETAMQSWLAALPQAVAVIEGSGTGLQSSRGASAQLAPILLETGHGLIMLPNGLDTAQKLIAREGVPSATLFRDFDGQGQDANAVRRFLDQGAMRAVQQEQNVILLGRVRPDTISALLLWGLQDRAASVALAPVSAVLQAQ